MRDGGGFVGRGLGTFVEVVGELVGNADATPNIAVAICRKTIIAKRLMALPSKSQSTLSLFLS